MQTQAQEYANQVEQITSKYSELEKVGRINCIMDSKQVLMRTQVECANQVEQITAEYSELKRV